MRENMMSLKRKRKQAKNVMQRLTLAAWDNGSTMERILLTNNFYVNNFSHNQ